LESALTAGIESVHLDLRSGNEAARRFYRAVGFSETIMIPRYYGGSESAVRMIRMLRRACSAAPAWVPPAHWR
ncbi:MAG TPA: hypothetical protein VFX67_06490, partial [Burkholderiales bacterium]|nr:hypothetical protein [Burkholderiales bacterium]